MKENKNVFVTVDDNYKCHCDDTFIYVDEPNLLKMLEIGDLIYINYGDIILEVVEKGEFIFFFV